MLFQIFQRHSTERLVEISFEDLKEKMAKIQKELKKPTKQNDEQSYLDYFSELLDKEA
ncbi:MAG: hypothetical protein ABI167_09845 [Nitrosospira sp.]